MIRCYSLNNEFYNEGKVFSNFNSIETILKENSNLLIDMPINALLLILNEFSKKISSSKELLSMEGAAYLSLWLKKDNLEKILKVNLKNKIYLDNFLPLDKEDNDLENIVSNNLMKAQQRGIVCHWIAGNVPTLAMFSLVQSILTKNSNLVRIPKDSVENVIKILSALKDIVVEYNRKKYNSNIILNNTSIVYFNSKDKEANLNMSYIADIRIIWGGQEAIDSISRLDKKSTCKDIIFGPKYSFALFDKSTIESNELDYYIRHLVSDIISFEQKACSSPQVLFVEKSKYELKEIAKHIGNAFDKASKRLNSINIDEYTASNIINKRGEYGLSLDKDFLCSKDIKWTILIDNNLQLEEPIQGRTLFLKEVESLFDVVPLITPKVQTVGIASNDREKTIKLATNLTKSGVDRVTTVGSMNLYDSPWDGILLISELVRWCTLRI